MNTKLIAVVVVVVTAGVVGGVWAWETVGPGACGAQTSVTTEYGPESLAVTVEESPEFGATLDPEFLSLNGRRFEIWKDGDVVQSLVLDHYQGGWVISGYFGCIPGEGQPTAR